MKDINNLDELSASNDEISDVFNSFPVDSKVFEDGEFKSQENITWDTVTPEDKQQKYSSQNEDSSMSPKKGGYRFSHDIFKIIGLTVSGLLLVLSLWTMAKSFVPAQQLEELVLSYNVTNSVDYKINLSENSFYETPFVGKGELVPVTFIDTIEIDFSGFLSASKTLDLNYTYRITGEITATANDNGSENSGGKIWTKNYTFVSPKTLTEAATTGYTIQEKVNIDYKVYNDLVNQYKLKAAIPMDAVLTVTLSVDANSMVDETAMNESNSVSVKIPLSVSTVMVTATNDEAVPKTLIQTDEIAASKNYVLLGISIVIFIASLITTIMLLKSLRKMTEDHSVLIKFNKIMRDYSQIIIEIEELPEVNNAATIEVKTFRDMLDVQKELHLPIMCSLSKEGIITDNVFYIINQNQIFKYRMNADQEKI